MVEARDLEKKDCNMLGIGKSDPYAVVRVGAQEYKTRVSEGTVDPKWDFWCEVRGAGRPNSGGDGSFVAVLHLGSYGPTPGRGDLRP